MWKLKAPEILICNGLLKLNETVIEFHNVCYSRNE